MVSRVDVSALGVTVGVSLEGFSREQLAQFERSWSRCVPTEPTEFTTEVRAELVGQPGTASRSHLQSTEYEELADRLASAITISAIEMRKNDLLLLHAGGVADPKTGSVVAYIGPSGRGKTTASMALARTLGYVTDETLAIRDDLSVVAYPKPLSVKQPAPNRWKAQASPDDLELGTTPSPPLRLVALVLLDRDPDYPEDQMPLVVPVSLAEAISELVPQISYLPAREAPLHRVRDIIAACGGLRRVTYRESDTLLPVITELLALTPRATGFESWTARSDDVIEPHPGQFARAGVDDAIEDGASLIVLNAGTVRVLDGIAPTIWRSLSVPESIASLVESVVAVHGEPPEGDAEALVKGALEQLQHAGLVVSAA